VKTFVGTSANALKIQIWTALIAVLLVKFLQLRSKISWHLSRFAALLRQQLFVYRCLWRFLDQPFESPPQPPPESQLPLFTPAGLQLGQQKASLTNKPHPPESDSPSASPLLSVPVPEGLG
jgi:hypothetical protein